jgi:hypothetical protein
LCQRYEIIEINNLEFSENRIKLRNDAQERCRLSMKIAEDVLNINQDIGDVAIISSQMWKLREEIDKLILIKSIVYVVPKVDDYCVDQLVANNESASNKLMEHYSKWRDFVGSIRLDEGDFLIDEYDYFNNNEYRRIANIVLHGRLNIIPKDQPPMDCNKSDYVINELRKIVKLDNIETDLIRFYLRKSGLIQ